MSSALDERKAYRNNPYFAGNIKGDFSPFYVTISICSVVLFLIIVLNIVLGCCSKHRRYWQDRHTGNRWVVSIWSTTPHLQPPLDFTELKDVTQLQYLHPKPRVFSTEEDIEAQEPIHQPQPQPQIHPQRPQRPESRGRQQHHRQKEEYVELHKRESDI